MSEWVLKRSQKSGDYYRTRGDEAQKKVYSKDGNSAIWRPVKGVPRGLVDPGDYVPVATRPTRHGVEAQPVTRERYRQLRDLGVDVVKAEPMPVYLPSGELVPKARVEAVNVEAMQEPNLEVRQRAIRSDDEVRQKIEDYSHPEGSRGVVYTSRDAIGERDASVGNDIAEAMKMAARDTLTDRNTMTESNADVQRDIEEAMEMARRFRPS